MLRNIGGIGSIMKPSSTYFVEIITICILNILVNLLEIKEFSIDLILNFSFGFLLFSSCFFILNFIDKKLNICVTNIFVIISVLLSFCELYCIYTYNVRINEVIIKAIIFTNLRESFEYLKFNIASIFASILLFSLAILLIKYMSYRIKNLENLFIYVIIVSLVINIFSIYKNNAYSKINKINIERKLNEYSVFRFTNALYYTSRDLVLSKKVNKNASIIANNSDIDNIIIILGESATRSHFGVYGYFLNTTPNLERWHTSGNIILFKNVISPICGTDPSIAKLFTFSNYENNMKYYYTENLMKIMENSGYRTYWISNQEKSDRWGSSVAIFSDLANHAYFTSNISSYEINVQIDTMKKY